jgi:hypothetical protein
MEIVSNGGARVKWLTKPPSRVGGTAVHIVLLALAAFLIAAPVLAAPFDPSGTDWEGYGDFVRLLKAEVSGKRIDVESRIHWGLLHPNDALIVVFPDHPLESLSAGAFVRSGGRLALIDDFGAGEGLLTSFNIERVPLPARPALALRDNPAFAIAEPGPTDQMLTRNLTRVVTNHATGLWRPELRTVLQVRGDGGGDVPIALSASSGAGRLVAIGDPSIFMNAMLRYAGNAELAKNLGAYLLDGHPAGQIHLVVRSFTETGSVAGAGTPAEEVSEAFANAKDTIVREGLPPAVLYWLCMCTAVMIGVWLYPRAARTYKPELPRFTRPLKPALVGGVAGRAAALGAKAAYRCHAMLEWRRAFVDGLRGRVEVREGASAEDVVRRVARLGVVPRDGLRALERLLLRIARIETMVAAKQSHALTKVRDDEVVAAGRVFEKVLAKVWEGRR